MSTTYPRVAEQAHPLATGERVSAPPALDVTEDDVQLAREILGFYAREQAGRADGEWAWINEHGRPEYLAALRRGDPAHLAQLLSRMFRNDVSFGLASIPGAQCVEDAADKLAVEGLILLDLDTWREFTDGDDLAIAAMPPVGAPIGLSIDGLLVCSDQLRQDYYAKKVARLVADRVVATVLEIGGGYGGFALQLRRRRANQTCYIDCDLVEGLCLTYYFLAKATGQRPIWVSDDTSITEPGMYLVPWYRAATIAVTPDLVFNHSSLCEMSRGTVDHYMRLLHQHWQPTYFLHQNSNVVAFPNSTRHIEVIASQFGVDSHAYRELSRSISPWQGAMGRDREFLYERTSLR